MMKQSIYYREHYYLLPDEFANIDKFKNYISGQAMGEDIELFELLQNYGINDYADKGISLAPYFISGYCKSKEKVHFESVEEIYPVWVELLSQDEYNSRLRNVINEYCPGCVNYKPLSKNVRSLNGHFEEITLDKICFFRCESKPRPRSFRDLIHSAGGLWYHFLPEKQSAEKLLSDLKSWLYLKYDGGEFSSDGNKTLILSHKKDFFLSVLTSILSGYISKWLYYTEFRLRDSDETSICEEDVLVLLSEAKIEKFRKECKKYGVSLGVLEFPENTRAEIESSLSEPVKHDLIYPICRAHGKTYYMMNDTPVALKEFYFRFPMLGHHGASITVYSQADTRMYKIDREMKYTVK